MSCLQGTGELGSGFLRIVSSCNGLTRTVGSKFFGAPVLVSTIFLESEMQRLTILNSRSGEDYDQVRIRPRFRHLLINHQLCCHEILDGPLPR